MLQKYGDNRIFIQGIFQNDISELKNEHFDFKTNTLRERLEDYSSFSTIKRKFLEAAIKQKHKEMGKFSKQLFPLFCARLNFPSKKSIQQVEKKLIQLMVLSWSSALRMEKEKGQGQGLICQVARNVKFIEYSEFASGYGFSFGIFQRNEQLGQE